MKKRAVSPVIATVLLIALVTAAAAIVFLVVIPMLTPASAILLPKGAVEKNGNYTITIGITAEGSDIIFNGTVTFSPTIDYYVIDTTTPLTIVNGASKDLIITGSFEKGIEYSITVTFVAGKNEFTQIVKITP